MPNGALFVQPNLKGRLYWDLLIHGEICQNKNMRSSLPLRVGLGITFFWIGILIFQHPDAWANFLSPWFTNLLPFSPVHLMQFTSLLDIAIGALFILGIFTRIVAMIASLHLVAILVSSGITDVTIRDVGLLGATLALFVENLPPHLKDKLK